MSTSVAVVGGGPAGSRAAELLSRAGAKVLLYEGRRGWEKPCGGGVPERAVDFCPALAEPTLPQRLALRARIYSTRGREAVVPLAEPLRVFRRVDLNGYLLKCAVDAGAEIRSKRVCSIRRDGNVWTITDAEGRRDSAEFVVGADGASGVVRGRVAGNLRPLSQSVGVGYYLEGYTSDEIVLKFFDSLDGYLWIFPRPDHLAAGICAPAGAVDSPSLFRELERFLVDLYGAPVLRRWVRYGARIPSPPASAACSGDGWALVGDAAGFVDPLTREGIHYALASGSFLAEALIEGHPERYPSRWSLVFGKELAWAASHKDLFFSRRFIEAFTLLSSACPAVQAVVSDLVAGRQSYPMLRRRLRSRAPSAAVSLSLYALRCLVLGRPNPQTPSLSPL